jgi:hypothetical protein
MQISTKPFTKLFSSIITSSIWNENDKVRVVWITMLALADATGFVCASVGGLAHAARVTKEDCESALGYLVAPDDDSRSPEFAGRRVECVEGGFVILNYTKYRELGRKLDRTEYLAAKKRESRKRQQTSTVGSNGSTQVNKTSTLASASASSSVPYLEELKRNLFYAGVDIDGELAKAQKWCKRKNRRCTRRFFENWLAKADRLVETPQPKQSTEQPPVPEISEEQRNRNKEEVGKQMRALRIAFKMPV